MTAKVSKCRWAAITVVIASRTCLPISTTHILVGTVLGVGLARGVGALDLRVVLNIVISWVVTLPAGAIMAMFFYFTLKGIFG
jgi:PiT family inorganic phosphate transporter